MEEKIKDNLKEEAQDKAVTDTLKENKDKEKDKKEEGERQEEKKATKGAVSQEKEKEESKKYNYLIKNRNVRKHVRRQKAIVILLIFIGASIILGGTVYAMMTFIEYNSMKVLIDKEGLNIFSLSTSPTFSNPTEVLALSGPKYMDNITLMDIYHLIPEIEAAEGNYGDRDSNYTAATFYLKNVSGKDQIYREAIVMSNVTKDVDEAIRIMVIRNGVKTIYAKAKKDGEPEEVVPGQYFTKEGVPKFNREIWMAEPFISPIHVFYNAGIPLAKDEVVKYTMLVWLEGWDPECVDDILGGTIKLEFQFSQQ